MAPGPLSTMTDQCCGERTTVEGRGGHVKVFSSPLSKEMLNLEFYFGQCRFLYRHLLNGSLYSVRKTYCCHCPNDSQRSILSFLGGIIIIFCECLESK